MTPKIILTQMRALLKQGWIQNEYALNAHGASRGFAEEDAVCWCLTGALFCTTRKLIPEESPKRLQLECQVIVALEKVADTPALEAWNDAPGRTQAEVLRLLDKAIAGAEA